jgi:hypothetical protein
MRDKTFPSPSHTVEIEHEGNVYRGSYTIVRKMISVTYGSRTKTTQLGGSADAPEALAKIMLGEIVSEESKTSI